MHNSTMEIENLFAGEPNTAYTWFNNGPGTQHYAMNIHYCTYELQEMTIFKYIRKLKCYGT